MSDDTYIDPATVFQAREEAVRPLQAAVQHARAGNIPEQFQTRVVVGPQILTPEGEVVTKAPERFNTLQAWNPNAENILDTGRTQAGSPRGASELRESDLITVHGTEITVALALRQGYLARSPSGVLEQTGLAAREVEAQNAPKPEAEKPYEEALGDTQAEGALGELCSKTSADAQIAIMSSILTNGEVSKTALMRAADQAKMDPGHVQRMVEGFAEEFHNQAARTVAKAGVTDPQAFFDWAAENRPNEFRTARERHVMERNPKVFEALAKDFLTKGPGYATEDLLAAQMPEGMTIRQGRDGEVIIGHPSIGETSLKAALKQGLIKISAA